MSDSQEIEYEIMDAIEGGAAGQKKRGRNSKAKIVDALGAEAAAIEAEIARDRRVALIDEKFGDGQPYDRTRLEVEVKAHMQNASEAFFQAGRRLIQIKEHEGHGGFLPCLERIGIGEDTAERMMLTVRKIQDTELANSEAFRNLLPSKLYEIALFDQDQLDELGATGATGSITLDEIQRMTTREAKAALREERRKRTEEIDDREKVIKAKNDKIDELERMLRGSPPKSQAEVSAERLKEFREKIAKALTTARLEFLEAVEALRECQYLPDIDFMLLNKAASDIRDSSYMLAAEPMTEFEELLNTLEPKDRPDVGFLG